MSWGRKGDIFCEVAAAARLEFWQWPDFASTLALELWEGEEAGGRVLRVRVLFNGRAVTRHLSGCAAEYCPFGDFRRTVRALTATFERECGAVPA